MSTCLSLKYAKSLEKGYVYIYYNLKDADLNGKDFSNI
jgi:hypothetical protein